MWDDGNRATMRDDEYPWDAGRLRRCDDVYSCKISKVAITFAMFRSDYELRPGGEMVYATDLKSVAARHVGSIPTPGTSLR